MIVTFVVGMVVGSYLYLYGFAPQYNTLLKSVETSGELVIVGEAYGGCARGSICPSFQVASDGRYQAFPAATILADREVVTGLVSVALYKDLRDRFSQAGLAALAIPVTPNNCDSYRDGIDYRLRISAGDEQFLLDTCTTALASERAALQLLTNLVAEMGI